MLKTKLFFLLLFCLVGVAAAGPAFEHWTSLAQPEFRYAKASEGSITKVVRATGRVEPVLAVQVGSFVSGPIEELFVDFNDSVKKGDLMARIDARLYEAEVAQSRALLATQKAEVLRVQAQLEQAKNEEQRGLAVQQDNPDFISDSELDKLKYTRMALEAQLAVAQAGVEHAEAKLNNGLANLQYTEIRAPVDGVVIDRKVEPGQTVAATFATPVLFVVAPDLAGEMHVFATVDEADIGLVRAAQDAERQVTFTVDAYPEERFSGTVKQIRTSSRAVENVVTFPVVVATQNPDRQLLPGMTANLHFETEIRDGILRVPNAAIRFFPPPKLVREQDRDLLDPERTFLGAEFDEDEPIEDDAAVEAYNRRHVWVQQRDGKLKAVEVTIGISDEQMTEIVKGDLDVKDKIVVGVET